LIKFFLHKISNFLVYALKSRYINSVEFK